MSRNIMTAAQISLIEKIAGHLYAAKIQRSPTDDQIIAEHIEDAHEAAIDLLHSVCRADPNAEPLDPMRGVEFPFAESH
jgi:hypothetical protein